MKNIVKIIGIVLLIAGSALSVFTTIPIADYIGIGLAALGLAALIVGTYNKAEKKGWKEIATIALFAVSGFCFGFVGLSGDVMSQLAMAIVGVITLIIGLISVFIPKSKE